MRNIGGDQHDMGRDQGIRQTDPDGPGRRACSPVRSADAPIVCSATKRSDRFQLLHHWTDTQDSKDGIHQMDGGRE